MADDLATLRAAGWSVAVHNDYRLYGEPHTFWLFTHPDGRWLKGEGRTDEDAIRAAVTNQVLVSTRPDYDALAERCDRLEHALRWAQTILANMAMEHTTGWRGIFARWPISHEPLRADARGALPVIEKALAEQEQPHVDD